MRSPNPVRFNKANLLASTRFWAESIKERYKFTTNTGTAQLAKGDVDRAVQYGMWKALSSLAGWTEEGGFPDKEANRE